MKFFSAIIVLISIQAISGSALYGLDLDGNFGIVNPANGNYNIVKQFPVIPGDCAVDQIHGLVYSLGVNSTNNIVVLVGLDVKTGDTKYVFPTEFVSEYFVGLDLYLDVDSSTGDVYFAGPIGAQYKQHLLMKLTYSTQTVTKIGFFNTEDFLGGDFSCDPVNQILWAIVPNSENSNILGVSMVDASIKANISIQDGLEETAYDNVTDNLIGWGLQTIPNSNNFTRQLVSFDPKTESFAVIQDYPNSVIPNIIVNNAFALNTVTRISYRVFTEGNSNIDSLYGVNMDTGDVVSSTVLPSTLNLQFLFAY